MLIATHNGLFVADDGRVTQLAEGYYYGIATWPDRFIAAVRLDARSKTSPTAFDHFKMPGEPVGRFDIDPDDFIDVHQVTAADDGMYVCNSGKGLLEFWPFSDDRDPLGFALAAHREYGALINSVHVDGEDLYCILHCRTKQPSQILHFKHRDNYWINCFTYNLTHYGVHNVIPYKDSLIYNASDAGRVIRIFTENFHTEDWDSKGAIEASEFSFGGEYHVKGMALSGDTLVVGISDNGTLDQRFTSPGRIATIDLEAGEFLSYVTLPNPSGGELGNINEIRII